MNKSQKNAFTLIELLFVIVVIGIVGGFALEAVRQFYEGIYRTGEYDKRVAEADHILEQVSKYFENAISDSIVNLDQEIGGVVTQDCYDSPAGDLNDYTIAFIAVDIDSLQGVSGEPSWSKYGNSIGFNLFSPDSNYTEVNNIMVSLNPLLPLIGSAIYRKDGEVEGNGMCERYGWANSGNTNNVYAKIINLVSDTTLSLNSTLSYYGGSAVSNAYVLRTAYAFNTDENGTFRLYSNFRPWNGERHNTNGTENILAENVAHFQIKYDNTNTARNSDVGNVITLKICMRGLDSNLSSTDTDANNICRERKVHVRY